MQTLLLASTKMSSKKAEDLTWQSEASVQGNHEINLGHVKTFHKDEWEKIRVVPELTNYLPDKEKRLHKRSNQSKFELIHKHIRSSNKAGSGGTKDTPNVGKVPKAHTFVARQDSINDCTPTCHSDENLCQDKAIWRVPQEGIKGMSDAETLGGKNLELVREKHQSGKIGEVMTGTEEKQRATDDSRIESSDLMLCTNDEWQVGIPLLQSMEQEMQELEKQRVCEGANIGNGFCADGVRQNGSPLPKSGEFHGGPDSDELGTNELRVEEEDLCTQDMRLVDVPLLKPIGQETQDPPTPCIDVVGIGDDLYENYEKGKIAYT